MTTNVELLHAEKEALVDIIDEQAKRIAALEAYIRKLTRHVFGRKSEKIDPAQQIFAFVEAEIAAETVATPEAAKEAPDAEEPAENRTKKKGHGRRLPSKDLPRERVEILPPEAERHCAACDCAKTKIGEEVSTKIDFVPASIVLRETARAKFSCPQCQVGVVIAPLPPTALDKCEAAEGLLAHVVVSKYADHLPLHRQEAMLRRHGLDLDRSTMCDWVRDVATAAQPVVDAMVAEIMGQDRVHCDETPVKVQDRELQGRTAEGRLWTLVSGDGEVAYRFTRTRAATGPAEMFKHFRGYLHVDAYAGYDGLFKDGTRFEVGCWAHARRYFFEARDGAPKDAAHALAVIQALYAVERDAKEEGADPDRRRALRRERSSPLLSAFKEWLDAQERSALPKSTLGQAVGYALKQWNALIRYLEDGRLAIDNNAAERALRMVTVGRKNWLFCGSYAGGERAAVLYTLIANCKTQDVDPFAYVRDLLRRLPQAKTADDYRAITPKAWKAARAAAAAQF